MLKNPINSATDTWRKDIELIIGCVSHQRLRQLSIHGTLNHGDTLYACIRAVNSVGYGSTVPFNESAGVSVDISEPDTTLFDPIESANNTTVITPQVFEEVSSEMKRTNENEKQDRCGSYTKTTLTVAVSILGLSCVILSACLVYQKKLHAKFRLLLIKPYRNYKSIKPIEKEFHVLIFYSENQRDWVHEQLIKRLNKFGISCCTDDNDFGYAP